MMQNTQSNSVISEGQRIILQQSNESPELNSAESAEDKTGTTKNSLAEHLKGGNPTLLFADDSDNLSDYMWAF